MPKTDLNYKKLLKMIGGPGTTTPNYIRSATFNNTSGGEVALEVTFKSGNTEKYTIAAGGNQNVEKEIQKESHTEVDPITSFSATHDGKTSNESITDASGVENRSYNIGNHGAVTRA